MSKPSEKRKRGRSRSSDRPDLYALLIEISGRLEQVEKLQGIKRSRYRSPSLSGESASETEQQVLYSESEEDDSHPAVEPAGSVTQAPTLTVAKGDRKYNQPFSLSACFLVHTIRSHNTNKLLCCPAVY